MAIENVVNIEGVVANLSGQVSSIQLWIKGLGVFALIWAIYTAVIFWIERKKMNQMNGIEKSVKRIERKINRMGKK